MKSRRTNKLIVTNEKLVLNLARQLQAYLLEQRVTERLAYSPSDIKKFIERVFRKDEKYGRAIVFAEFQKIFGEVSPNELQRIINAGMDEAQRWQDYADGVVEKYEQLFPGKGKVQMVSIAKGDEVGAKITKSEAEKDKRRFLEAIGRYNSILVLLNLVWKIIHKVV
jgi:hypothetical protein